MLCGHFTHRFKIPDPHLVVLCAEEGVEAGVAGAGGLAAVVEGAIKAEAAAAAEQLPCPFQHPFHHGPGHDVGGVGAEQAIERAVRPLPGDVQLNGGGQIGGGGAVPP